MFFVSSPWQVFTLGVVMGLAVGADYSIGSPLLGEFAQPKNRGNYLGLLEISWNVGYVIAYLIGYVINTYESDWWRIILGASAVPRGDLPVDAPRAAGITALADQQGTSRRGRGDHARQHRGG